MFALFGAIGCSVATAARKASLYGQCSETGDAGGFRERTVVDVDSSLAIALPRCGRGMSFGPCCICPPLPMVLRAMEARSSLRIAISSKAW